MSEFLQQGGYAGYVWGAFGVTFGLLLIEVIQLRWSRRTILTRVGRLVRLRSARQAPARPAAGKGTGSAAGRSGARP